MRLILIPAAIAFTIDQVSKYGIVFGLDLVNRFQIDVLPPLVVFKMGWNTGINFGLFGGESDVMRWVLIALAVAISVWLLIWGRQIERPLGQIAAGLVIGGAFGNGLDRVIHGAVMDFLNMSCCGIQNPFAFNLADVAIFAGALGLVFFADPPKPKQKNTT